MKTDDLRTLPKNEVIEADVCIVGSGPAGLTIARELAHQAIEVVIIESGGLTRQPDADALNEIQSIGAQREGEQWLVRNRIIGGSSHTWRGRCAPFDDIDYERRAWVPYSGWPFTARDLEPFLARTNHHLGLSSGTGFTGRELWTLIGRHARHQDFDQDLLRPFFWQFSRDAENPRDFMRFGPRALKELNAPNIRAIAQATVTHINTSPDGASVDSLEIASLDGERSTVRAKTVVLCAGGIENARLLLASNRTIPSGVGNRHDVVGRFLMDHPRTTVATFDPIAAMDVRGRFGHYLLSTASGIQNVMHGLTLSPAVQKKERLLNCAVWLNEVPAADNPWCALRRLRRGEGNVIRDAGALASNMGLVAAGVGRRMRERTLIARRGMLQKLHRLELYSFVEQQPNPDSRITLGDQMDKLGMRVARVDWRIGEEEQRTFRRIAQLVHQEFKRVGMTPPMLENYVTDDRVPIVMCDSAHPTGTTRMSTDPRLGVVDADCQVHGVEGLFISGSSVFPTTGHANPTHMIVAVAIRLADKLKSRLGLDKSVSFEKSFNEAMRQDFERPTETLVEESAHGAPPHSTAAGHRSATRVTADASSSTVR